MLANLIKDPPPALVFEIAEDAVVGVRRDAKSGRLESRAERGLPEGVVEASAVRPNVRDAAALTDVVKQLVEELGGAKRTEVALLLPDASARLMALEFDSIPSKPQERLDAIKLKLEKSVPFDIDSARIAYQVSKSAKGTTALVAVTPAEVVRQYEEAFDLAGLWPGYVEQSMAASLNLLEGGAVTLFVKLSGSLMTIAAVDGRQVRMVRGVELTPSADEPYRVLNDMLTDLYPTRVYVEENLGAQIDKLTIAGFGDLIEPALDRFPDELQLPVEPLRAEGGVVGPREAGIWGYLSG